MKVFSTRLFLNVFTLQVSRKFCHGKILHILDSVGLFY